MKYVFVAQMGEFGRLQGCRVGALCQAERREVVVQVTGEGN